MTVRKTVSSLLVVFGLIFGMVHSASAEGRVLGSWISKGKLFSIGDGKAVFQGDSKGTVHHNDGKGKLDTGRLYCSVSAYLDERNDKQKANGFCTVTTTNDDKIYADFTCAGPLMECRGKFNHIGGTGEFKGISGETDLTWKLHLKRPAQPDPSADFVELEASGYFVLPNLTYTLS